MYFYFSVLTMITYSRPLRTAELSAIIKQLNARISILMLSVSLAVSSSLGSLDVVALKSSPVNKVFHRRLT